MVHWDSTDDLILLQGVLLFLILTISAVQRTSSNF